MNVEEQFDKIAQEFMAKMEEVPCEPHEFHTALGHVVEMFGQRENDYGDEQGL